MQMTRKRSRTGTQIGKIIEGLEMRWHLSTVQVTTHAFDDTTRSFPILSVAFTQTPYLLNGQPGALVAYYSITNVGASPLPTDGNLFISFYLVNAADHGGGLNTYLDDSFTAPNAGASYLHQATVGIGSDFPPGFYELEALTDNYYGEPTGFYSDAIYLEGNGLGNGGSGSGNGSGAGGGGSAGSDLSAVFSTQPALTSATGSYNSAAFTVSDAGPDTATGSLSASFQLVPTDSGTNNGQPIDLAATASASIADDVTDPNPIPVNFTVPANTPPGNYALVGTLTEAGGISDTDITDKTFSSMPILISDGLSVSLDSSALTINSDAEMPAIAATATVSSPTSLKTPHVFKWTAEIVYDDQYAHQDKVLTRVTTQPKLTLSPGSWGGDRGGTLTVTVTATVGGKPQMAQAHGAITGSEPGVTAINAFIGSRPIAGYPTGSRYAQSTIAHQIVKLESGYAQFNGDGEPLWSGDGLGGAGTMQITPASLNDIWNWKTNVADGIRKLQSVIGLANRYGHRVQSSAGFRALVAQVNAQQMAAGLEPLTITLPGFTSDQQVLIAVRAYNGVAGTDSVGLPVLQEFETAVSDDELVLASVDQAHHRGVAEWVEVDPSQRTAGDPNYVGHVLAESA